MVRKNNSVDDLAIKIGKKLKEFRTSKGFSRDQLAKCCGVTHQQIAKYENGSNLVSAARLFIIANFLEIPVNSFCNEEFIEDKYGRLSLELIRNFSALSDPEQRAINYLSKNLANNRKLAN